MTHTWDSDITASLAGTTAPNITLWTVIGADQDNFGSSQSNPLIMRAGACNFGNGDPPYTSKIF